MRLSSFAIGQTSGFFPTHQEDVEEYGALFDRLRASALDGGQPAHGILEHVAATRRMQEGMNAMFVDNRSAVWSRPSYSQGEAARVEVVDTPAFSAVRDTQNRDLGTLTFGPAEWRVFLSTTAHDIR